MGMNPDNEEILRLFKYVPEGWKTDRLYNLADYINGKAFKQSELSDKGLPVIKIAELNRGITNATRYCNREIQEEFYLEKGDLLFAWSGSVGVYVWNGAPAVLNQHIFKVRAREKVDQKFLRYLLQYNMPIFKLLVKDKTTTMGHVTIEDLKHIDALIPMMLEEQHKIAEILGSLDGKIELNFEMNRTLETIAQLIFESWFVDFEQFQTELNKDLEREIPRNWEVKPFSQVIRIDPKRKLAKGSLARKISMPDLRPWQSWIESWHYAKYTSGPKFQNGDVLFARITPSLENGKTALVSCLNEGEIAFGTTEFIVFAPKIIMSSYYIFCLARTYEVRQRAIRAMSGSSGRQRVPKDIFDHIMICVPPPDLVEKFDRLAHPLFEAISINGKENRVLAQIRDALLSKLLSGEIRANVKIEEEFREETNRLNDVGEEKERLQKSLSEWC